MKQNLSDAVSADDPSATVVATPLGRLRGRRAEGVTSWRGIPYAAPPVGPLRFRAPQPPLPWSDVRAATAFGASAPQPFSLAEQVLGLDSRVSSAEDCLTLNVWSCGPGGEPRPVMVWLHGGSFLTGAGSDPLYDGAALARAGDVVVVTLNYRLGPLGFLHLAGVAGASAAADENLGLRDQIAALGWVRDAIAAFGGDPGQVTLFGQSAGAMAIGALLGAPAARGLFHRAILQSGAARHVHDRRGANRLARDFLATLGLRGADMAAMRTLPVDRIVVAGGRVAAGARAGGLPFQPVVDGRLLPQAPLEAIRAGAAAGVPLLIGTNRDELALYGVMAEQDPASPLRQRWRRWRALATFAATLGLRRLMRLRRAYPPGTRGAMALVSDAVFGAPAVALAEAQAPHAPVYVYRFDRRSPAYGGRLGACHALEVPFVWQALGTPAASTLTRDDAPSRDLAAAMRDSWIAFARNGDPAAPNRPPWPRYERTRRATMIFDAAPHVEDDPDAERRRAWALMGSDAAR